MRRIPTGFGLVHSQGVEVTLGDALPVAPDRGPLTGPAFLRPDCANDFQYLDGLHRMLLKPIGSEDVQLQQVLNQPVTRKEMEASKGMVQQGDRIVEWSAHESIEPPLGSVLVGADSLYWTILAVTKIEMMQTYKAQVRNLSIRSVPVNVATILHAKYKRAAGNDRKAVWSVELENIPARFQPSAEAAQIFLGGEYIKTTYRVIFQHPVPMQLAGGEYRLRDSQGWLYRVELYMDEERIDTLPVAIAVRIVEPAEYPHGMPEGSASGSGIISVGSGSGSQSGSGSSSGKPENGSSSGSGSSSESESGSGSGSSSSSGSGSTSPLHFLSSSSSSSSGSASGNIAIEIGN